MNVKTLYSALIALLLVMFGPFDDPLQILLCFIGLDYFMAIMCSLLLHKSKKTRRGGLSSKEMLRGIFKKFSELALVCMANMVGVLLGSPAIRDFVIYGLVVTEALSVLEIIGKSGVPVPGVLIEGLEILNGKGNGNGGNVSG